MTIELTAKELAVVREALREHKVYLKEARFWNDEWAKSMKLIKTLEGVRKKLRA